jgi:5'-3' exonuclease
LTIIIDSKLLAYNELHAGKPIVNLFNTLVPMIRRIEDKTMGRVLEVLFVYDIGKSEYRLNLWPNYKGKRNYGSQPDNFKVNYELVIPKLASLLGITNYPILGVEADDLAGILCNKLKGPIVLVSGDHDWLGITLRHPENVQFFNVKTWELMDFNRIKEFSGCTTEEQFLIKKAILGDSGDNIIGIPGVGPVKFKRWAEEAFVNSKCLKEQFLELCHKANDTNKTHRDYSFSGVSSCEELYEFNMSLGRIMSGVKHLTLEQKVALNTSYTLSKVKEAPNLLEASELTKQYSDGHTTAFGDPWFLSEEDLKVYERIYNESKGI